MPSHFASTSFSLIETSVRQGTLQRRLIGGIIVGLAFAFSATGHSSTADIQGTSDEKLALSLGRCGEKISDWVNGEAPVDSDALIEIIGPRAQTDGPQHLRLGSVNFSSIVAANRCELLTVSSSDAHRTAPVSESLLNGKEVRVNFSKG
jgi:hypothetical protein